MASPSTALAPNKRAREDSNVSAIDNEIQSMKEKLKQGECDNSELLVLMFNMLDRVDERTSKALDKYVAQIADLKKEVKDLSKQVIRLECEAVSNCIIIKGLPYSKSAKNGVEKFPDTEKEVIKLIEEVKANDVVDIIDVQRFKKNPKAKENDKPALVKVRFANKRQVFNLFGKLKNLKNSKAFGKVQITREIPPSLMGKNNILGKIASEMRKEDKNCKTKIMQVGIDLILMSQTKDSPKWEVVNVD